MQHIGLLAFIIGSFLAKGINSQLPCSQELLPANVPRSCFNFPRDSVCVVSCPDQYQPIPGAVSLCDSGVYPRVTCSPIRRLVAQCESTRNDSNCPYTLDELTTFYENNFEPSTEFKMDDEFEGSGQETGEVVPEGGRGIAACNELFCTAFRNGSDFVYTKPTYCTNFRRKRRRNRCITCRFTTCRSSLNII